MTLFSRLAALVPVLLLVSCGETEPDPVIPDGSGLAFEYVTPPVEGGDSRVLQEVEAMGDSVYVHTAGVFVSFDKRRTWKAINAAALGQITDFVFVTPTAGLAVTGKHGLTYIELDKDLIYYLNDEPAWADWALRDDGTLFTVRQAEDPVTRVTKVWLGRRRDFTQNAPWPEVQLPTLPSGPRSFRTSIHVGGKGEIYVASRYGLQVSRDEGQSWQQIPLVPDAQGSLSWSGLDVFVTRAGTLFVREPNTTFVSYDGGASYVQAAYPGGIANRDSMMVMEEATPGALYFRDLPYRSTDEGRTYELTFSLERHAFDSSSAVIEALFFRGGEYYFNLPFVSNFVSATPETSLAFLNPHQPGGASGSSLSRAFPLRGGRYVALWKDSLLTHTPGEPEWKFLRRFPNTRFLWKLRDGRLLLQELMGVRLSSDEGETWSEPTAISKTGFNSVSIETLVETPDRLVLSGEDSLGCDEGALMESRDGGESWRSVGLVSLLDTDKAPVSEVDNYKVSLSAADRDGKLFASVFFTFNCSPVKGFRARSEDLGHRWVAIASRLPVASTSRNHLLALEDNGPTETFMSWDPSQEEWLTFGPPVLGGQQTGNLFSSKLFLYLDAQDVLYSVHGDRVLKSSRPLH